MQPNTKNKILECARQLFNEKSYQNVTMRDISSQLGISVGNLTYHFKKKEDILKELMKNAAPLDSTKNNHTLSDLNLCIFEMLDSIQNNLFFFISDELSHLDDEFTLLNQERIHALKTRLFSTIKDLKMHHYFSEQLSDEFILSFSEMIMLSHLTWARNTNMKSESTFNIQDFVNIHWNLLIPFFTEKACIEYHKFNNQ